MEVLNTLYVTQPESYLRLENNTLRVDVDGASRLQVPLHHLGSVVCFGHVGISVPLMHRLAEDGTTLVMLDMNGRFKARLEGQVSGNVLLRREQHRRSDDAEFALNAARACVAGKLRNGRAVLLRGAREAKQAADQAVLARGADDLAASLRGLPAARGLDALRGI
jgi:CRISPR-associated protein Cas1